MFRPQVPPALAAALPGLVLRRQLSTLACAGRVGAVCLFACVAFARTAKFPGAPR